jgi:hypothetical protein
MADGSKKSGARPFFRGGNLYKHTHKNIRERRSVLIGR